MEDFEPKLIAEGSCGTRMLRLYEKRWQGIKVLDCRLWYWHDRSNEWRPGKQGIQLSAENWRGVLEQLQTACDSE